ncbi:MAG: truA [Microbacteriaceae bacterium]|nr:truA [Microbacteriaceae bacterium]
MNDRRDSAPEIAPIGGSAARRQPADGPTTRIRLDLAYDGSAFLGWAKQPGLRTVQGELESALATIFSRFGPPPVLTVAGRTDAGVHAIAQVAHLDLTVAQFASLTRPDRGRPAKAGPSSKAAAQSAGAAQPSESAQPSDAASALARRLNGIAGLNSDVYVSRAAIAPPGFDARFSAIWRRYEYRVSDATGPRNPLERNRTLWYPAVLDVERMDREAASLVGLHDWASYCKPRDGATTIRILQEFRWSREPDGVIVARLQADAFCHSMVRALVGASIAIGEGRLDTGRLAAARDELARTSEFKVVPAKGLTLVELGYPDDAELAARAEQTRARRIPVGGPLHDPVGDPGRLPAV